MAISAQFTQELTTLLNRYSLQNGSDTPDFLLANYLLGCLYALDATVAAREQWYGRTTHGAQPVPSEGDGTL
jgi:hypothetical protein